jgi:hypothetical protein
MSNVFYLVDDLVITVQPPPPPEERRRRYADEEEDGEWEEWEEEQDWDRDNMVEECPSFRQDKASAKRTNDVLRSEKD